MLWNRPNAAPSTVDYSTLRHLISNKRRVELGSCGHEHACIRCPMLSVNPTITEGWQGEVEGLLTLVFLRSNRDLTQHMQRTGTVTLGLSGQRSVTNAPG